MPKQFYTERDIEKLVSSGTRTLSLNDDVVLTEQAYEAARRLGMALLQDRPAAPPSAPVRPYLSTIPADKKPAAPAPEPQPAPISLAAAAAPAAPSAPQPQGSPTAERIRAAVIARLGDSVDPALLNTIIRRVLDSTGIK